MFFKNELKKRIKNEKGLTLIELLAVIVILAIIAAIAIPAIGNIIQNSRDKAVLSEATNILSGAKIAHTDGACDASAATSTCKGAALNDFIDGITLADAASDTAATATVTLTNGEWSIVYSDFKNIKRLKHPTANTTWTATTSLKESELNAILD